MRLWDSGQYESISGGPDEGKWEFHLAGGKLKGAFVIFLMKGRMKGKSGQWLIVKKKDGLEQPGFVVEAVLKP